jgi:hypothetical protein
VTEYHRISSIDDLIGLTFHEAVDRLKDAYWRTPEEYRDTAKIERLGDTLVFALERPEGMTAKTEE